MKSSQIFVLKSNGEKERYQEEKLALSLERAGATPKVIQFVLREVSKKLHPDIKTKTIYSLAFQYFWKKAKFEATTYNLKKSLLGLGPSGFHFEKFISYLFQAKGYKATVGKVLKGRCITHEIDIIARRKDHTIFSECKFHNHPSKKNDIKIALYVSARSDDLSKNPQTEKFNEFWLITNTCFSADAIKYSQCVGLKLFGLNFPEKNTIHDIVIKYKLHPITCLRKLKILEKKKLLDMGVIICKSILEDPHCLKKIGLEPSQIKNVLQEVELLVKH